MIVVLGGLMIVALTGDAETVVVEDIADDQEDEEPENPWAEQGDAAISLVQNLQLRSDPEVNGDEDNWTVGKLVGEEDYFSEILDIGGAEAVGWESEWWGETKFGPSYFRVRFGLADENVTVGPTWVVDLQSQDVVPKNVFGRMLTDPEDVGDTDYADQAEQVVSAIVNHRFPADINLGGALLSYFGGLDEAGEKDRVLGWTVNHSHDDLFEAYFQWTDDDEYVHAQFEFDMEDHALRPANLQANEIMRVGDDTEPTDRVDIMPGMYDPDEPLPERRWQGPARQRFEDPAHRDGLKAMAMILDNAELIETLEWTLTYHFDSLDEFEECQEIQEGEDHPRCRWVPREQDDGVYRVHYFYDLGDGQEEIAWDVHVEEERVEPVDTTSELAYRAVHPRGS